MRERDKEAGSKIAYFIDYSIHAIPSIAYIARETGGTIYTDSELTYRVIRQQYPWLSVTFKGSISAIREDMISKAIGVIIYPDYHIRYFRDLPVKHVQVFHGTSDKRYDYSRSVSEYDLFFIAGNAAHARYKKKGLLKNGCGILIGYPKLDRVFRGELKRDEELTKLNLDPAKKCVLYAPTWVDRALNSSWKKFRSAFSTYIPDDLNFIIKLHPNLKRYRPQEVDEFVDAMNRWQNARLIEFAPDPVPLMAASDLLIGDVSAITREYLAFQRPFVFLSSKPPWLWSRKKIKLWECGEVVRDPKNLWDAVERVLRDSGEYAPAIRRHFKNTFYKPDGSAAARAKEAIYSLLPSVNGI